MIDVIILAGGKGTRMEDPLPKPLVIAKGKPILSHQLDYIFGSGKINKVILAIGYMSDQIVKFIKKNYSNYDIDFSIEQTPLGTAGSLKEAIKKVKTDYVLVLNCDDITDIDISNLISMKDNIICIAHPRLPFGLVIPSHGKASFKEKPLLKDWVSCGWYLFNKNDILPHLPLKGSLEYDVFPKLNLKVYKHTGIWNPLNTKKDISDFENSIKDEIF